MIDLEKVKEALKHIIDQPDEFMFTAKYLRCYFQEIIGEPDNPIDEDVLQVASRWVTLENNIESLAYDLQQFAASYHARECAKCKALPDESEREA